MNQRPSHNAVILVCALAVAWWGILNGQTVPAGAGGAGAVPIRISLRTDSDDTLAPNLQLDNLEIEMLRIEIEKAEETA